MHYYFWALTKRPDQKKYLRTLVLGWNFQRPQKVTPQKHMHQGFIACGTQHNTNAQRTAFRAQQSGTRLAKTRDQTSKLRRFLQLLWLVDQKFWPKNMGPITSAGGTSADQNVADQKNRFYSNAHVRHIRVPIERIARETLLAIPFERSRTQVILAVMENSRKFSMFSDVLIIRKESRCFTPSPIRWFPQPEFTQPNTIKLILIE